MILQTLIFVFSASAIWCVTRKEKWNRWGYVLGLLGQPLWLYMTIVEGQWGIFLLCLWYSYSWGQGVYNFWLNVLPFRRRPWLWRRIRLCYWRWHTGRERMQAAYHYQDPWMDWPHDHYR